MVAKEKTDQAPVICGVEHFDKDKGKKCHWIIRSDTEAKIFGMPYKTKGEAMGVMSMKNLSGYHLAHRINSVQEVSERRDRL